MKIGLFTPLFHDLPRREVFAYCRQLGLDAVEMCSGALVKPEHCDPDVLLNSPSELQKLKDELEEHQLFISQLNCAGNPVSPIPGEAKRHHEGFEKTVLLAEKLGVHTIAAFSGCPGGGPKDETPNWITCPWPDEFVPMLRYQWEDVLIPYWTKAAAFAQDHGVTEIGLEMHPGFCVYNPETLLKLRAAVGDTIGSNFDPSHLFWQGIDIPQAIVILAKAIFHVHAKDTRVLTSNIEKNGVLDTKHYGDVLNRAWVFGTVGFGHGETEWRRIIDTLSMIGYDGVVSIEHEDSLKSKKEGLELAVSFLKRIVPAEKAGAMWWA